MVPTGVHIGEKVFPPKASLVTVRDMYRDHRSILVYPYLSTTIGYTYTYQIGSGRRRSALHSASLSVALGSALRCTFFKREFFLLVTPNGRETVISEFQLISVHINQAIPISRYISRVPRPTPLLLYLSVSAFFVSVQVCAVLRCCLCCMSLAVLDLIRSVTATSNE